MEGLSLVEFQLKKLNRVGYYLMPVAIHSTVNFEDQYSLVKCRYYISLVTCKFDENYAISSVSKLTLCDASPTLVSYNSGVFVPIAEVNSTEKGQRILEYMK